MPKVTAIQANSRSNRKKLRVAAYCRVSTDSNAQLESLETQMAHYEKYINDHSGWEYVGLYYDDGISGTNTVKRTEFNRMIEECMAGKIDMVITKSISRFARNTIDCLNYIRQLKEKNIPVVFEKENINTMDASGEVLLTIFPCPTGKPVPLAERAAWTAVPLPERQGERQYQVVPRIYERTGRQTDHRSGRGRGSQADLPGVPRRQQYRADLQGSGTGWHSYRCGRYPMAHQHGGQDSAE